MTGGTHHQVTAPLRVRISKKPGAKGEFLLNLNTYRNAHFYMLDKAKKVFKDLMAPQIKALPRFKKIHLEMILYPGSSHLCDVSNICSIVEKFFADALVELGKLEDDNYQHLIGSSCLFGEIDKVNPRVEIFIIEEQ